MSIFLFPHSPLLGSHSVFLSIFPALAIPSPTHACHRHCGGSSLISGVAKNRERQSEGGRQRLCSFNTEEIVRWDGCCAGASLAKQKPPGLIYHMDLIFIFCWFKSALQCPLTSQYFFFNETKCTFIDFNFQLHYGIIH